MWWQLDQLFLRSQRSTLCHWVKSSIIFKSFYNKLFIPRVRQVKVLLGSIDRYAMPVERDAVQVNRLNSYNPNTLKDDISLIKLGLAAPISSSIKPIALPTQSQASNSYANTVLVVSGFGLTTANQVSNDLQYTQAIGITTAQCQNVYGLMITPSILCTRGYPNLSSGSCQGIRQNDLRIYFIP